MTDLTIAAFAAAVFLACLTVALSIVGYDDTRSIATAAVTFALLAVTGALMVRGRQ
jgi:hypothetical protein